ncbi:hypothetical protein DES37_10715 [Mangrovibacter plantisponsor]|uniref:Uncharacterized protein n=1 Tax=Mangrovibacter plantisponsor TaxID=451513 RepID=A0A317PXS4_9ENTR|nr:hypothetical protein DES37_10715 [Mangrovibacter plantisponsor]
MREKKGPAPVRHLWLSHHLRPVPALHFEQQRPLLACLFFTVGGKVSS